jgi:hypothetical protein
VTSEYSTHFSPAAFRLLQQRVTELERENGMLKIALGLNNQEVPGQTTPPALREALAAYAHQAWSGWMHYFFEKCEIKGDRLFVPEGYRKALVRQMTTHYTRLSPEEQDADRREADRILAIVAGAPPVAAGEAAAVWSVLAQFGVTLGNLPLAVGHMGRRLEIAETAAAQFAVESVTYRMQVEALIGAFAVGAPADVEAQIAKARALLVERGSTPDPATCQHEWREEYYGTRCARCDTFYPDGCAPWDLPVEGDAS